MRKTIKEPIQYESMIPKIVKQEVKKSRTVKELDFKNLVKLAKHAENQEDLVKSIKEIFPDIELAIELVTSLITAPNDMTDGTLNYKMGNFSLPTEVASMATGLISTYMDTTYNIEDKLNSIIEESLFTKGSFIELNIPPKNISDLLTKVKKDTTVGVESILKTNGDVLSSIKKDEDGIFEFTSNPSIILSEMFEEKRLETILDSALDDNITAGVENLIMSDSGYGIMNEDDISADKPIIKKIASSKVIPVANSEDPSKHYGYFIILDQKKTSKATGGNERRIGDNGSDLLNKVNQSLKGMTAKAPELTSIDDLRDVVIKTKLQKYLDNSNYKNFSNIEFDIDDDLILDMAESIINKSPISVLFMPSSLVSYYAINFRSNGMGESLLERLTVLMSMRAILVFTKMLSYIKSSVTTTDVKVDLDPDDPEYRKSMEAIMAEVIKNRQVSMPIGILNTDDLTDWVHKLGFSFNFKHPGLPDVNIDIEERANEINPIDDGLKEDIDKLIITSLYLTPEMIDNSYSPDFATTIIANNLLLKKRIMKLQRKYNILLTADVVKKLKLDGKFKRSLTTYITPLIGKIRKHMIKNNPEINPDALKKAGDNDLISFVVNKIIENIKVSLQRPEVTEDTNNTEMVSNYSDLLDDVIDKLFSSDLIPSDYIGSMGDNLDDMKNLIKHTLLRRYIDENNVLPDFTKMFVLDEDGKPLFNLLDDFNTFGTSLEAIIVPFLKNNKKMVEHLDKKQEKLDGGESDEEDDNGSTYNSTGDAGGNSDTGMDEEPTDSDTGDGDTGADDNEGDTPPEDINGDGGEELPDTNS